MTLPNSYPSRIWACPGCRRPFSQKWLLARHLQQVHHLRKAKADDIASRAEYLLAPRYLKKEDLFINPDDYRQGDEK